MSLPRPVGEPITEERMPEMERRSFRVLLIEDDEDDYVLVKSLFSQIPDVKYALEWVRSFDEGVRALYDVRHDVCLLDYRLDKRDGMDILLWAKENGCGVPIIFLTGQGDYALDLEAMRAGAADYLVKNEVAPSLLERSIRYAVGRKCAEEALRESEERFRFIAESSGDVLYRLSYDSMRYDYLSPSIEILTGYTPDEIRGMGLHSLIERIDTEGKENVASSYLKQKRLSGETGEYRADYLMRAKSGALKWVSDHSVPWRDRANRLVGSIGILVDITERKVAEEALRESERQLRLLSLRLLSVQEAERTRLARNLHDTVGQSLAAIKYVLESALNVKGDGRFEAASRLFESLVPVLQDLIGSVRRLYMELRPSVLDDFGIVAAIKWLCREFEESNAHIAIESEIHVEEEQILPDLKSVIFRIAQDALSNISLHSKAAGAMLALRATEANIELEVCDNGIGFPVDEYLAAENPAPEGFGICSMRERTRLSRGYFSILSELGKGTAVRARWPLIIDHAPGSDGR